MRLYGHGIDHRKPDAFPQAPLQGNVEERSLDVAVVNHGDTPVQTGKQVLQDIVHIRGLVDITVGNAVDSDRGLV